MGAGFHVINANLNSVEVGVELGKNVPFFLNRSECLQKFIDYFISELRRQKCV